MYIRGDIFINPSYPLYFGIGYKRFEERIKGIVNNLFVRSISVQKVDVPKDTLGNVNLDVTTTRQFEELQGTVTNLGTSLQSLSTELATQVAALYSLINNDNDKLYDCEYVENTKTLVIIPKNSTNEKDSI